MSYTIISYVMMAMKVYSWLLIARILMSWVPDVENSKVGRFLVSVTEPYLGIFRRFIPPLPLGGAYLDLSPIVAIFAWSFVREGVLQILKMVLF